MAVTTAGVAIAGIVASVVGAGVSVYGQQQQAKTQNRLAVYNNRIAEQEAKNRETEASEAIRRQRIQNRRQKARMRAALAGSGALTTTGSPLAIMGDTAGSMELAIADAKRRTGMQTDAMRAAGQMGIWEADQTQRAANISSIGTGVSALSNAASSYSSGVYNGTFNDTFGLYNQPRTRTVS